MSASMPLHSGETVSWQEYAALPEDPRVEYVGGRLLVSPSPTRRHQRICHRITSLLQSAAPAGWDVTAAWSWKTGDDEYIPDVMVHPVTTDDIRFTGTPVLVVEVLSSNRADDLVMTANRYAAAGLANYWIVDPREETLSAYVLAGSLFRPQVHLTTTDGPTVVQAEPLEVTIDLTDLLEDR